MAVLATRAGADPDLNLRSRIYNTFLVQAMDECASAVTNVGGVGACPTANAMTDGTNFIIARVIIRAKQNSNQIRTVVRSARTGPPAGLVGKTVHLVIMLRITRTLGEQVTWVDQVLDCPDLTVDGTGRAKQKLGLTDCGLDPSLAENSSNKEVLSVQLVDSGTGDVIAVPGLRNTR